MALEVVAERAREACLGADERVQRPVGERVLKESGERGQGNGEAMWKRGPTRANSADLAL